MRETDTPLQTAIDQGVPLFLDQDIARSSPANASPYLIDPHTFIARFAQSPARQALVASLRQTLLELAPLCEVEALLVGGSLLDVQNDAPRDFDAVLFYAMRAPADSRQTAQALAAIAARGKARALDLRFVPTDAGPQVLIKAACYFAMLYSSERDRSEARKGALLITQGSL
ncbi:DUF6932 family protein [Lysobacter tyrosinilyticus]